MNMILLGMILFGLALVVTGVSMYYRKWDGLFLTVILCIFGIWDFSSWTRSQAIHEGESVVKNGGIYTPLWSGIDEDGATALVLLQDSGHHQFTIISSTSSVVGLEIINIQISVPYRWDGKRLISCEGHWNGKKFVYE